MSVLSQMNRRINQGRSGGGAEKPPGGPKKSLLLTYDDLAQIVIGRCMGKRAEGDEGELDEEEARKYAEAKNDDKVLESVVTKLVWKNFGRLDPKCFLDPEPNPTPVQPSLPISGSVKKGKGKLGKCEKWKFRNSGKTSSAGVEKAAGDEAPRVPAVPGVSLGKDDENSSQMQTAIQSGSSRKSRQSRRIGK